MAAAAGPQRVGSVDIDPGWYEGQLETADAAPEAGIDASSLSAASAVTTDAASVPAMAVVGSTHVPTVLTKLQKWGDYESFGKPVWPARFIPMKTPLSHEILDNWQLPDAPKHRLTVSGLLEAQRAAGRRVGLLLDLSNHDCLYEGDIPSDVAYIHVQLVAKELPPLEFVREVAAAANGFWANHPEDYIAIHCAYGFNRTGFVVCSYLIEQCGLSVEQALASFAASRPPGVKHEKFREELRARSSSSLSSSTAACWPPPGQAEGGCAAEGCCTAGAGFAATAATRADSGPAGAAAAAQPVCCCCGAELSLEGQLAASPAGESAAEVQVQMQRQLPPLLPPRVAADSSCSDAGGSCSGSNYFPQPPLPSVQQLTPSSSRAVLSGSPAPRMPARCWSSNSVGDNSSIGCSPDSSTVDLLGLRLNSLHSTSSGVGLDGSQVDTPGVANHNAGLLGQHRLADSNLQQGLQQPEQQQEQRPVASGSVSRVGLGLWGRRSSADSGQGTDAEAGDERADGNITEDGCFEMDPCEQQPQQQVQHLLLPTSMNQVPAFKPSCCPQATANCSSVQQLPMADLDSLLSSISIVHQQHQQQQLLGQVQQQQRAASMPVSPQVQQQQQGDQSIQSCDCSCHSNSPSRQHHLLAAAAAAAAADARNRGSSGGGAGSSGGGRSSMRDSSWQLGEEDLSLPTRRSRAGEPAGSVDSPSPELLDNESFGKLTSAELLTNLRSLRHNHEGS